jgi:hypothetical protein
MARGQKGAGSVFQRTYRDAHGKKILNHRSRCRPGSGEKGCCNYDTMRVRLRDPTPIADYGLP